MSKKVGCRTQAVYHFDNSDQHIALIVSFLREQAVLPTCMLAILRRSGDVGLLLVLDGGLLEVLGRISSGVLLLGELGATVDLVLLLGGGLAAVLGGAVGGVGFGLEAVDFGLGFGDVLLREMLVYAAKLRYHYHGSSPPWSCSPGSPSSRRASASASRRRQGCRSAAWAGRRQCGPGSR